MDPSQKLSNSFEMKGMKMANVNIKRINDAILMIFDHKC